jgi:dTDP-4-amino-4,6-dideoxygalactose transaminase
MVTAGQGGAILTDDQSIAARLAALLDYDSDAVPDVVPAEGSRHAFAFNHQLTDVPAAVGVTQLARLGEFVHRRRAIAANYNSAFARLSGVTVPAAREGAVHGYYRYVLTLDRPAAGIASELQASGIDARSGVAHFLPDYLHLPAERFPNAASIRTRLLSLPIYPSLTEDQVMAVSSRTRDLLSSSPAVAGTGMGEG